MENYSMSKAVIIVSYIDRNELQTRKFNDKARALEFIDTSLNARGVKKVQVKTVTTLINTNFEEED